jgi:hypothetical protein
MAANAVPGSHRFEGRRSAAFVAEVATVRVVGAATTYGVTVAGEKLHDAPEGRPEQANETAALNPFAGTTATVVVPLSPAITVIAAGVAAMEKSGGKLTVYHALARLLMMPLAAANA